MTHDELLDAIYWHWRKDPRGDGLQPMVDYRGMVLAVVYLHKPYTYTNYKKQELLFCSVCETGNPPDSYPYPCPTIQAIEKEIG